ncbi:MAG: TIGR03808 family TAT-translocated repetitive protein [Alphaproteobacteria bacterium]|nr:TIGR03808 family TAT-translocated repetitive protein [Alphaproteobacteria bacterium]
MQPLIDKAVKAGVPVALPGGDIPVDALSISGPVHIVGVPGQTRLVARSGGNLLTIESGSDVVISGVTFDGGPRQPGDDHALVTCQAVDGLVIENCHFMNSGGSGLRLQGCSGRVTASRLSQIAKTALFARDSRGLEISGNDLEDIGNNGIQVWTSTSAEDGTLVYNNRISKVAAEDGGTGQNGNGINVFRAGNVVVTGNRISDCAFSAIRNNAGSNCQISNNSISRTGEVAIYCEFGFEGAIVNGNLLEDVALGISITNFNEGGRLASVANNIIRRVTGGGSLPYTRAVGIGAEADTLVTGNVIEEARDIGISLGWGGYARNLVANGNLLRNCGRGIVFSVSDGAEGAMIINNRIAGCTNESIVGADHGSPETSDLGLPGIEIPKGTRIDGNMVN